jgi:transposase
MKLHRNAKSTPTSRLLLVRRVLFEDWSYAEAAQGFAVSVRTVAKWVRRFREGGVAALEDASSRPGVPPHQTPPGAVALIRLLREQHGLPAWAIGRALRIRRSTVSAWLRRLIESSAGAAAGSRSSGTNGPIPAISCPSISSRSGAVGRLERICLAVLQHRRTSARLFWPTHIRVTTLCGRR